MPLSRTTKTIAAALALAVLGGGTPARAVENAAAVDPRAASILKAALENVAAAKSFTVQAEITNEVPLDSGQRVQILGTLKSYVRRPDRLTAVYQGEDRTNGMYYDGKVFTLANPLDGVYSTWEAPATLEALLDTMEEKIGFTPPLSVLLRDDAGSGGMKNVRSGIYVGRASVRGVDCHHLAFAGPKVDFQVWVADGVPVIKRVVVTYKNVPTAPQYTATFTDWDFDARLGDYLFTFAPPPGATRIEFKVVQQP